MKNQGKSINRKGKIIAVAVPAVLLSLAVFFFWYVSDYYRAEDSAFEVLEQDDGTIVEEENYTILYSLTPSDTAIIFYPGAKVETEAYLPLLDQIRETGVTCILVDMPFHMAIFDFDAAEAIMEQQPEIQHWYLAGHSMGGAMASRFSSQHEEEVEGLILMGAYIYGDYPLEKTLTIYGTLDGLAAEDIDYTTNTVPIEGGNHAQFGNYGSQKGDSPATISTQEQQKQTVEAVKTFIEERQGEA